MADKRIAPDGAVWVCGACGKTHKDRYGMEGEGSRGWDESCMLNAVLCHESPRLFTKTGTPEWTAYAPPVQS